MKRAFILAVLTTVIFITAASAWASEAPDLIKLKKDLNIASDMVVNDVIVIDGDLTVSGRINGNVIVVGGTVKLNSGAFVGGNAVIIGEIYKDPNAQVAGKITQVYMPSFVPSIIDFFKGGWVAFWAALGLLALIGFIGLSVLALAFLPTHMGAIVGAMERSFFMMFLWGLIATLLIAPIAVLLLISIIGIVLIPVEILLVALALIVGYVASAIFIGNKIFAALKRPVVPFLNAIIGILVLSIVGFVPVIGTIIKSVFLIAGYGAVVSSGFGNGMWSKRISK